jgi:hypothetical protein
LNSVPYRWIKHFKTIVNFQFLAFLPHFGIKSQIPSRVAGLDAGKMPVWSGTQTFAAQNSLCIGRGFYMYSGRQGSAFWVETPLNSSGRTEIKMDDAKFLIWQTQSLPQQAVIFHPR